MKFSTLVLLFGSYALAVQATESTVSEGFNAMQPSGNFEDHPELGEVDDEPINGDVLVEVEELEGSEEGEEETEATLEEGSEESGEEESEESEESEEGTTKNPSNAMSSEGAVAAETGADAQFLKKLFGKKKKQNPNTSTKDAISKAKSYLDQAYKKEKDSRSKIFLEIVINSMHKWQKDI